MLIAASNFNNNALIFRGVVTGYSQHLYSAFLFAPKYKYELISGEFIAGVDFYYTAQKELNVGQSVELIVHKEDSTKMTLRSNNLYLPGSVLAFLSLALLIISAFFLHYVSFHFL